MPLSTGWFPTRVWLRKIMQLTESSATVLQHFAADPLVSDAPPAQLDTPTRVNPVYAFAQGSHDSPAGYGMGQRIAGT